MTSSTRRAALKLPPLGLAAAVAVLALSVVAAFSVAGSFAYGTHGVAGLTATGIAAAVCWLAATAALVITGRARTSPHAVAGMLFASGIRFGLPLLTGFALQQSSATLAAAGIFGWTVLFYLLVLAVETTLSVLLGRDQNHGDDRGVMTNG